MNVDMTCTLYKKASEFEMNKKAHLEQKVQGNLRNVIGTVSGKDAEILRAGNSKD